EHRLMTNIAHFSFPAYLRGRSPTPYVKELTGGTGVWMGHKIDDTGNVRFSPAYVNFECDNMLLMQHREPIDQADVTSLIYMSMKPTDYAAHRWGLESLEVREALRAQDACVGRLIEKLNARVGESNYVVTITADHGMMPMPEVVNGHRLFLRTLLEMIDKKFGARISLGGGFINLWFDQKKMKEIGIANGDIAAYLRSLTAGEYYGPPEKWPAYLPYRRDERLFFNAYTYEQVEAYVKANPTQWMVNPYATDGTAVTLEHDLERLDATRSGMGYLVDGGFLRLGEREGREVALGLVGRFWMPSGGRVKVRPDAFRDFAEPGNAKVVWTFAVEPLGTGTTRLVTETRVQCLDAASRRRFRLYWLVVRPFSGLIRHAMLGAVAREATRPAATRPV